MQSGINKLIYRQTMFHPDILKPSNFLRFHVQQNAIDSATDTAHGYGIPVAPLAKFLRSVGIDAAMLSPARLQAAGGAA